LVITVSLHDVKHKGIVWRTSRKVHLLYPWARHLIGCLYFDWLDR